jgi:hypothetical protein
MNEVVRKVGHQIADLLHHIVNGAGGPASAQKRAKRRTERLREVGHNVTNLREQILYWLRHAVVAY